MKHYILFVDLSKGDDDFALFKKKLLEFVNDLKKTDSENLLSLITLGASYNILVPNQPLKYFENIVIENLKTEENGLCLFDILAPAVKKLLAFHSITELKTDETNAMIFARGTIEESVIVPQASMLLQFMYTAQKKWKLFFASPDLTLSQIFKELTCKETFVFSSTEDSLNQLFTDLKTV